jgi:hypothetical protein
LAIWYDEIYRILPGSKYLGAIIDGRADRVGTLARAVNESIYLWSTAADNT